MIGENRRESEKHRRDNGMIYTNLDWIFCLSGILFSGVMFVPYFLVTFCPRALLPADAPSYYVVHALHTINI